MNVAALNAPRSALHRTACADAPAKINLTLDVLGRRPDGYHEIRSLMIAVDLRDHLRFASRSEVGVELRCGDARLAGPDNLAAQAVGRFAARTGQEARLRIDLDKHIPVGAGLGGGSSDAATALRACNQLCDMGFDRTDLAAVGAEVGSDVPFFFSLPSAVISGRGEQVTPVTMRWTGWVLLVFPGVEAITSQVYNAWREEDGATFHGAMDQAIARCNGAEELAPLLSNHLEPAIFRCHPTLRELRDELDGMGLGPIRMTGSGSTIYRLFDEEEPARRAAARIEDQLRVKTAVVSAPAGEHDIFYKE
jgi:4-diphosphocytidyl-2-C-methyl-D-erythritol kinase